MKHRVVLGLLAASLLVSAFGFPFPSPDAIVPASAPDVVGGRQFYVCAAFQAIKIVGLFTGNVPLVVTGAIGGGLACGFGW
jgi:hypothetical protein